MNKSERDAIIECCAAVVDQCNREGPYEAIGAARRIRALKDERLDIADETTRVAHARIKQLEALAFDPMGRSYKSQCAEMHARALAAEARLACHPEQGSSS